MTKSIPVDTVGAGRKKTPNPKFIELETRFKALAVEMQARLGETLATALADDDWQKLGK